MKKQTRYVNPPRFPTVRWVCGAILGVLAIGAIYLGEGKLLSWVKGLRTFEGLIAWPSFFLVPMLGGLVASYVWRPLQPRVSGTIFGSLMITLAGIAGASLFLKEGTICLIIVSPLLLAAILAGALLGRIWFKVDPSLYRFSILPMVALLAIGEPLARTEQTAVVTDEVLIHATVAKVWPEVTAFHQIREAADFWLFRLGLPYPQSTTKSGDFVGADRSCIFSGGAVFKERVVDLTPEKKLTFDIIGIPHDPELIGHLAPERGQFLLRDNGDGTTTLVGSTWYVLHVRPLWYFDWWTRYIFRKVHLRVMEDIRRRAESAA